jgi:hypothetical protein
MCIKTSHRVMANFNPQFILKIKLFLFEAAGKQAKSTLLMVLLSPSQLFYVNYLFFRLKFTLEPRFFFIFALHLVTYRRSELTIMMSTKCFSLSGYLIGRFKFSARVLSGWNVVLGAAYIAALVFFSAVGQDLKLHHHRPNHIAKALNIRYAGWVPHLPAVR